jgi:hypothetical protein
MANVATEREWVPEADRLRLPVDFPVTLEATSGERREVAAVINLGPRGMFAASRMLLPPGTPLRVTFFLPRAGGARPVVATARVRWVNDPAGPRTPDLPGGMGLEFVGLDGALEAELEGFLDELTAPAGA